MWNLLYNKEFLRELDKERNKTIYARITALKMDESPLETIQGRITGGSINFDGASAVRRTCSLTMVAQNFQYNNYYWGLNTKFKLEIGVENHINPYYPDIIWFNQGIYLITNFNTSHSTNNFTISINGKDKMCMLNGEVGGSLEAQIDFGTIDEENADGVWVRRKYPIIDIIKKLVHDFAGEPLQNIIINDLPEYGLELLEYRYDIPMYLYGLRDSDLYSNALIDGSKLCRVGSSDGEIRRLDELTPDELEMLVDDLVGRKGASDIFFDDSPVAYKVAKIEYGQTAGYRKTDLVYAGDLVANVGESLTSVLDKIKNMLGEFEYFYDVDGRFIFQRKKTYVNIPWNPIRKDEKGEEMVAAALALDSATAYTFNGGELITQFNNNPNLLNMKNDYIVRGERTGMTGSAGAIVFRYAIDTKPIKYRSVDTENAQEAIDNYNQKYNSSLQPQKSSNYSIAEYDWREIIYQMARDQYQYGWMDDFEQRVAQANPEYSTGRTGYEQYYMDMISFWRDIYYPISLQRRDFNNVDEKLQWANSQVTYYQDQVKICQSAVVAAQDAIKGSDKNTLMDNYKILIDVKAALEENTAQLNHWTALQERYQEQIQNLENKFKNYLTDEVKSGWHHNVFEKPELINFWFDFLDTEGELSNFNVKVIGSRAKVVNDTKIKSIYYIETPDILFVSDYSAEKDNGAAYTYIQVPQKTMEEMFSISAQGKPAKTKVEELINQHGYAIESATITTIPIYHLEPNTRVYLHDDDAGLDGDYIISKLTIPLTYNGTMSITATKAARNIFE